MSSSTEVLELQLDEKIGGWKPMAEKISPLSTFSDKILLPICVQFCQVLGQP